MGAGWDSARPMPRWNAAIRPGSCRACSSVLRAAGSSRSCGTRCSWARRLGSRGLPSSSAGVPGAGARPGRPAGPGVRCRPDGRGPRARDRCPRIRRAARSYGGTRTSRWRGSPRGGRRPAPGGRGRRCVGGGRSVRLRGHGRLRVGRGGGRLVERGPRRYGAGCGSGTGAWDGACTGTGPWPRAAPGAGAAPGTGAGAAPGRAGSPRTRRSRRPGARAGRGLRVGAEEALREDEHGLDAAVDVGLEAYGDAVPPGERRDDEEADAAVLEQVRDVDLVGVGKEGVHLVLLGGGHAESAVLDLDREARRDVLGAQQHGGVRRGEQRRVLDEFGEEVDDVGHGMAPERTVDRGTSFTRGYCSTSAMEERSTSVMVTGFDHWRRRWRRRARRGSRRGGGCGWPGGRRGTGP